MSPYDPRAGALDPKVLHDLLELERHGAAGFLRQTTRLFVEKGRNDLETLRRALAATDARELEDVAHSLKGSAGSVGAVRLSALCKKLEERARRSPARCGRLVRDLEAAYEQAASELGRLQT